MDQSKFIDTLDMYHTSNLLGMNMILAEIFSSVTTLQKLRDCCKQVLFGGFPTRSEEMTDETIRSRHLFGIMIYKKMTQIGSRTLELWRNYEDPALTTISCLHQTALEFSKSVKVLRKKVLHLFEMNNFFFGSSQPKKVCYLLSS